MFVIRYAKDTHFIILLVEPMQNTESISGIIENMVSGTATIAINKNDVMLTKFISGLPTTKRNSNIS